MRSVRPVKAGDVFEIEAIRWHEPCWEFDCPTAVLSPVFRTYEDGRSIESAAEDVLIDACIDGELRTEEPDSWAWRGWTQDYLRRKKYRRGVERQRLKVLITLDEDGELSFDFATNQQPETASEQRK